MIYVVVAIVVTCCRDCLYVVFLLLFCDFRWGTSESLDVFGNFHFYRR